MLIDLMECNVNHITPSRCYTLVDSRVKCDVGRLGDEVRDKIFNLILCLATILQHFMLVILLLYLSGFSFFVSFSILFPPFCKSYFLLLPISIN